MAILAAALVMLALLALPQAAGAACPKTSYDTGGAPRSGAAANDPLFPHQWGLRQIDAPGAWARGARGKGVTIAIVDSGVDLRHPDLASKILPGKDLVRKTSSLTGPGCPGAQDENGHGTHVAGIAAAITNNGIGVAGTAPGARILPVRVLDANGAGEDPAVNAGIRWAADHGARVINLSLGGGVPLIDNLPGRNSDTEKAVAYAYKKGAVVVASAGNESIPLCDYPAAAKNAVCVAATDSNGLPAAYSNLPADPDGTVAVRAPGGAGSIFCENDADIWSTMWPASADDSCGSIRGYETLAGTSMSAPFVSGVAALLVGRGLKAPQILQCLKTTSSNHGTYEPVNGYGIVNANAAVAGCGRSTKSFSSGTGGGGGKHPRHHVTVRVKRTTRAKLAKTGRLKITVGSDRGETVKLQANVRRGKKSTNGANGTVKLNRAGSREIVLILSKKARRALKRSKKSTVQVRYTANGESGVATMRR